jgi:DNA ligase (NAD+)
MQNVNDIRKKIARLSGEISRHQDLYYKKARPEIPDREYDALFDELLALEKKYPELALPESPTKRVGSDLDNDFPEVRHPFPMLSLDKVYTNDELQKWIDKISGESLDGLSFVIEEKVDGSTIVLQYENGLLARAVTRGDGTVGNDITENVRTIRDIPLRLTEPVSSFFRGEIYISTDDFEKLNREMDNIYANPRNFSSGSLRRKKSREVAKIPLHSFVYEGFLRDDTVTEHITVLHRLTQLGFKVGRDIGFFTPSTGLDRYGEIFHSHSDWVLGRFEDIRGYIRKKWDERENLEYEIDGLVVKVNETRVREKMGFTSHHPRWAMAFKFEAPQAVSEIIVIEEQIGRTGRVTPVARIKPVWISGSTVSNVTLHNQDYVTSLDVAVGDKIAVSRRGDVIPAVEEVIEKNTAGNKTYTLPEHCPVCSTILVRDGAHHFCPNTSCPARVFGRIAFFVARGQMDIENLGYETVKRLLELKRIQDIPDLYFFDADDLLGEEGFAEKKIELIKEGLEKSRDRPFEVVMASLGLDEIGPKVVELLVTNGFDSMDKLLQAARKRDSEIFEKIEGIGPKTAEKIIRQLNDPLVLRLIEKLKQAGLNFSAEKKEEGEQLPQIFRDEVWCVTGSFEHFKPRDRAMDEVKMRGGTVVSSITGTTTHLLAGENPGSKLDKARKNGVEIVNEEAFIKRLGFQ